MSFERKIPLSPSSPAMYLSLFLVWGKKRPPPPPLHLGVCTIHRLADQSVTGLIDCYRQVGVMHHSLVHTNTVGLRNYQGWEFAHWLSERIACFLQKNEQMSDSLKKTSDLLIRSFLVSNLSNLLMVANFW